MRFVALLLPGLWCPLASGACKDVVDLSRELPPESVTPAGITLTYEYDLDGDRYWFSWRTAEGVGGPVGPFHLTMSCGTSELAWETDRHLVLHRGCGTFCWYWEVVDLKPGASQVTRIERPLAHDADRALVARYADRDVIEVLDLDSGISQRLITPHQCDFASGLCFDEVEFNGDRLRYRWRTDPAGDVISQSLNADLLDESAGR